jgi:hypothetical protein
MTTTIVFAFEPVPELEGRSGVCVVDHVLAEQLIAEGRAEDFEAHRGESMRYVTGSAANVAAAAQAAAQRDTRGLVSVRRVLPAKPARKAPRLER